MELPWQNYQEIGHREHQAMLTKVINKSFITEFEVFRNMLECIEQ